MDPATLPVVVDDVLEIAGTFPAGRSYETINVLDNDRYASGGATVVTSSNRLFYRARTPYRYRAGGGILDRVQRR